jgi:uncharacterized repeat protein (TIGR03803 family)
MAKNLLRIGPVTINNKNPLRRLLALSNKSSLRAVQFAKMSVLGTILAVAPLRGAMLEPVVSLTQNLAAYPQVRLANGTFYGTDFGSFNGATNHGSVFKLGADGTLTTLYQFQAATQDEANPTVLIGATDGTLYGATAPRAVGDVNGMIFKLTPSGTFTPIFRFQDGRGTHVTSLIQAADGNFYGTAAGDSSGGFFNHPSALHNPGIFFKLTPAGVFTILYTFTGGADGSFPNSLTQGADGNFYGSSFYGPESPANVFTGYGTIFKITPAGVLTTLHTFTGGIEGGNPGKVIQGKDGNLYGITDYPTIGTLFKINPAGELSTIYSFSGISGSGPSRLISATDGNIYGTTQNGGIPQAGSIFRLNSSGQVGTYLFDGAATGGNPSEVFEGENHNLYGVTSTGGASNHGTIFRLNMEPPRNLLNISTRLQVLTNDKVLIGGFIIIGNGPKKVIIRGIGPSLTGVGAVLQNPTLELHLGPVTVASNDDWRENQSAVEATTIPPTNDFESAIVTTLYPGAYTAILAGKNGGTGIGIVEVYDLSPEADSQLVNISTRGFVEIGAGVMIGGLIVDGGTGGGSARVIVRVMGPSLSALGLQGALQDPELELHDASGAIIASNDNWKTRPDGSSQQGEVEATVVPPANDKESALVQTLAPGNYTAIVRGVNSTTGIAVVEVYTLQ